jgi:PAS domain S-box-containing protein
MTSATRHRYLSAEPGSGAPDAAAAPPRIARWLIGANLVAALLIAALTTTSLVYSRRGQLERSAASAANSSVALRLSIEGEIKQVDLLLRSAILAIEHDRRAGRDDPAVLQRLVQSSRSLLPALQALRATDAHGMLHYGDGVDPARPISLADRDYFRQARDKAEQVLVVSEPLLSPITGQWVVAFARRLTAADGSFAGIVYATVATERFREILASTDLGRQGVAMLRSGSMHLVAIAPATTGHDGIGTNRVSAEMHELLRRHPAGGTFTATTALDGVQRITAISPVGAYPFYVVAGHSVEAALAVWRDQLRIVLTLAAGTVLVLGASSWFLALAWQRESHDAAARLRDAQRHKAWLRTANDGIHVVDRQGRLIEFSDAFAAMLGYERQQMSGMTVAQWEVAPAEQAAQWCLTTQGDHRFKTQHRRADGAVIDVEISSTTARVDGEELIFCASRDITERRRLEDEVRHNLELARQSEQRVLEIADNVPAAIAYVDRNERMQFVNAVLANWLGRTREELKGCPIGELLSPERYRQRKIVYPAIWRGETVRISERIPSLRGNTRNIETVLVPKRGGDGRVVGFYSLSQDFTERAKMESTVERQARNLAAMTSISDDIMVVMNEQGEILLANRAFEAAWELPAGGAVGRTVSGLYGEAFFHKVFRPMLQRALDGQLVKVRAAHTLPGRPTRVFDAQYHPVYNNRGMIDAVVFTAHDVDDLVHSRNELAHTVEQLQRSNELLEQFVRVTSHDMREPLNTIAQFVSLIEAAGPLPPPTDRYFAFVRRGATRMRALLDDLLRFVRLEAAAIDPDEVHQLDDVLHEVLGQLQAQITNSHGSVHCEPLPPARGRRSLLVLLFQNLVSNALKFTEPGVPPKVTVSARLEHGRVLVTVADQGIGIAPEHIPTLFEPFRRLHRRQVYEGTGLGLATCKRIVMVLNGSIDIESAPGEGTRVTVSLPAA